MLNMAADAAFTGFVVGAGCSCSSWEPPEGRQFVKSNDICCWLGGQLRPHAVVFKRDVVLH